MALSAESYELRGFLASPRGFIPFTVYGVVPEVA